MAEEQLQDTQPQNNSDVFENTNIPEVSSGTSLDEVKILIQRHGISDLLALSGLIETVTVVPTHVPTKFYDQFKIYTDSVSSPTIYRLYWYSNQTKTWQFMVAGSSVTIILNALLPSQTGNSGEFLTTDGTNAEWVSLFYLRGSFTAGENLTAGEVVALQKGGGYGSSASTVYAFRAAANDATYGPHILGIVETSCEYLATTTVILIGKSSGFTGLTEAVPYYLGDYAASSETITQDSQDAEFQFDGTNVIRQIWVPTSSRLDKLIVKARKNGGAGTFMTIDVKRAVSTIATLTVDLGVNSETLIEKTFDFTDVRTYKGELLNLYITCDNAFGYIGYKSGSNVYNPNYQGSPAGAELTVSSGSGTIAADSDLYMKIYEYTGFGAVSSSAGTRKFKVGISGSPTEIYFQPQTGDAIL